MTTTTDINQAGAMLADALSTYVNTRQTCEQDTFFAQVVSNDHRTLQQKATATMLTAIFAMARNADGGFTDPRNEVSAAICQKIRDLCVTENVYVDSVGAVRFPFI